jgi:hypothetical protein
MISRSHAKRSRTPSVVCYTTLMNKTIWYGIGMVAVLVIAFFMVDQLFYAKEPTGTPAAPMPAAGSLDPRSAAYMIDGKSVQLVDGSASTEIAPGSASRLVTNAFGLPTFGDLNGDGVDDAAMFLTQDGGGSGTFYYVVAAVNRDGRFEGTNAVLLGDRIAPQTVEIRDGVLIANYADRNPGEPLSAQPSVGVSKYLKLENGQLTEVEKPAGF